MVSAKIPPEDIPPARIDFCTVAVSAPDNSSHHIYMYGGHKLAENITATDGVDDVYVLTIPSFTWTTIYNDGASPRYGHQCHRAGKRQMITVGGNVTNTLLCDWEAKGVAFLDMSTITWGSVFLTNTSDYFVAQKLLPATGGTAQGNATIKEPGKGWTNPGLKTVFNTPRRYGAAGSSPSPSATSTPKKSHAGAIAGGVVGGVLGLALIAGFLFFLKRRRDKARKPHELSSEEIQRRELETEEKKKFELQGINENNPAELPGPEAAELNAPREFVEADPGTASSPAAELSGTSVVPGGSPGIPQVRTPGDDLPTPPLYTPGLVRHGSRTTSPPREAEDGLPNTTSEKDEKQVSTEKVHEDSTERREYFPGIEETTKTSDNQKPPGE